MRSQEFKKLKMVNPLTINFVFIANMLDDHGKWNQKQQKFKSWSFVNWQWVLLRVGTLKLDLGFKI